MTVSSKTTDSFRPRGDGRGESSVHENMSKELKNLG